MAASGTPEINAPAKPDLFETSGNSGQYSYSYPFTLASGPDRFAPQLQLVYSSQSTNSRYSRRAPAGEEGEGFSLSLGSITAAQYPSTSTGGAATWYSINGVDGVSDKLVPFPNKPGYYETEHLSHLLIQFTGACWRVWGKEGSFFSLGCTSDSAQKTASGTYEWDLDEILAPYNDPHQVKTMLVSYIQDSPDGGTTIRDSAIKQIQYGYATTINASSLSLVAGTVDFHYHAPSTSSSKDGLGTPWTTAYGNNYHCTNAPSTTSLRCDDPVTYNGVPMPSVMATMTLDSITSYVGSDSANQPAYQYTFTYQDFPYTTSYFDPYTLAQQAGAGEHLLMQMTPCVYVASSAHARKAVAFGYSGQLRDSYLDPNQLALGSTTTHFSGQTFWSYLSSYQDLTTGEGARITYATAYGNLTGTPYVTDSQGNGSSENTNVAITSYHYTLSQVPASDLPVGCHPITGTGVPAQEGDCVADNWSPGFNGTVQHDGDWADYFHAEFRGFSVVYTTSSSKDLTVDAYAASEGWWTPESKRHQLQ